MRSEAVSLIEVKRKALAAELARELRNESDPTTLSKLDERLSLLSRLESRLPQKKPSRWLLPLSVAVGAASGLTLAASIRLSMTDYELDAKVDAVTFEVAKGAPLVTSGQRQPVTSFSVVGTKLDSSRSVLFIDAIKIHEGATVNVASDGSCFAIGSVQTQLATSSGTAMTVGVAYREQGIPGDEILLPTGASLKFCAAGRIQHLVGRVTKLSTSKLHFMDVADGKTVRTSSIISGSLRIPQVSKTVALTDADRLSLIDASAGSFALAMGNPMRALFSGKAGSANLSGLGESDVRTDLAPSALDYLSKNAVVASLIGLFTGLVGSIWAIMRYLGFASQ